MLDIECESRRISLGLKQLRVDPWLAGAELYRPGTRVVGRVLWRAVYGLFLNVEPDIDGLLHTGELSWRHDAGALLKEIGSGDELEVVVLDYDLERRRMSFGLKQVRETIANLDIYLKELENELEAAATAEAEASHALESGMPADGEGSDTAQGNAKRGHDSQGSDDRRDRRRSEDAVDAPRASEAA